jgi:hypothetical protein
MVHLEILGNDELIVMPPGEDPKRVLGRILSEVANAAELTAPIVGRVVEDGVDVLYGSATYHQAVQFLTPAELRAREEGETDGPRK